MQMKRKNHANNIHDALKSKIRCHCNLMTTWKLYTRQKIVMCSRSDKNKIDQCCAAHIFHSIQQYC